MARMCLEVLLDLHVYLGQNILEKGFTINFLFAKSRFCFLVIYYTPRGDDWGVAFSNFLPVLTT